MAFFNGLLSSWSALCSKTIRKIRGFQSNSPLLSCQPTPGVNGCVNAPLARGPSSKAMFRTTTGFQMWRQNSAFNGCSNVLLSGGRSMIFFPKTPAHLGNRFYCRPGKKTDPKPLKKKAMQGKFRCYICPEETTKKFDSSKAMKGHFKDEHLDLHKLGHGCDMCGLFFSDKKSLDDHDCLLSEDRNKTAYKKRVTQELRCDLRSKKEFPPCNVKASEIATDNPPCKVKALGKFSKLKMPVLPSPCCVEIATDIRNFNDDDCEPVHLLSPPAGDELEKEEVAEKAVTVVSDVLMSVVALLLPSAFKDTRGEWNFIPTQKDVDLQEKVVGIVSSGKKTRRLVKKFISQNANVLYFDMSDQKIDGAKWEKEFDSLVSSCDILVFCETNFMMDEGDIEKLKHGVIVVSDTKAYWDMKEVLEASKSGQIAGFAMYCSDNTHRDCPVLVVKNEVAEYLV